MNRFSWASAGTISEAAAAASVTVADAMTTIHGTTNGSETSVVKAGGIDLLDLLKENLLAPAKVVSLKDIADLTVIVEQAGGLRIGSMVTLASLAADAVVRSRYPALTDAAQNSASPQIRNVATLGGNLLQRPRCWYFRAAEYHCLRKGGGHCFAIAGENQYHAIFDNQACAIVHPSTVATVLVALGARLELRDAEGATRNILLEDFFVSPDHDLQRENDLKPHEILTAILLPALPAGLRMAHCIRAAVILGAAAPVPHRAGAAESILIGKRVDESAAREAARAALIGATPLAKNAYKLPLFETLVRRAILKAAIQS